MVALQHQPQRVHARVSAISRRARRAIGARSPPAHQGREHARAAPRCVLRPRRRRTRTAEYLGLAADELRGHGRHIDNEVLAHVFPAQSESIGLFGTIPVDIDAELAHFGPTGHRHLRQSLAPVRERIPHGATGAEHAFVQSAKVEGAF
jgi:hypothetical protein